MVTATATATKMAVRDLSVAFGRVQSLKRITLDIQEHEILGIIGPANSGKTTLLRMLNRMNDATPGFGFTGDVMLDGTTIYRLEAEVIRRRVGMVFALPMPLPLSIFDNVAYGPRLHGIRQRSPLDALVAHSLQAAGLWEEVKDRLETSAFNLSGGQQQRLCIARTLALEPEVILFDEPCSGLDPISTAKVEEAMFQLKEHYTLVLVTNNTKQAARVADRTAFFLMGELVEIGPTERLFTVPKDQRTNDYIAGKFG